MSSPSDVRLDVIIPVGPGHEETVERAVASVEFAMTNGTGVFDKVRVIKVDDTKGLLGRSRARNNGTQRSDADWLFFLDADDLMHPDIFLCDLPVEKHAIFGLITELIDGNIVTRWQVPRIENYGELLKYHRLLSVSIGYFVRRSVAEHEPFNEDMDAGEDWEMYLRLWKRWDSVKINFPFRVKTRGNHSTGPRSATGRDWDVSVEAQIEQAREEYLNREKASGRLSA